MIKITQLTKKYGSFTAVAAIAFSEDDIAAAKIAATTRPDNPLGMYFVMKSGKTRSPPVNGNAVDAAVA